MCLGRVGQNMEPSRSKLTKPWSESIFMTLYVYYKIPQLTSASMMSLALVQAEPFLAKYELLIVYFPFQTT